MSRDIRNLPPDEQRAALSVEDPQLPQAVFSSRGLYGTIGVLLALGERGTHPPPLRLDETAAVSLANAMLLMLELSCDDNDDRDRGRVYREARALMRQHLKPLGVYR